jgi:hypothetical protein
MKKEKAIAPAPAMENTRGQGISNRKVDTVIEVTAGSNSRKKGILATESLITVTLMRECFLENYNDFSW